MIPGSRQLLAFAAWACCAIALAASPKPGDVASPSLGIDIDAKPVRLDDFAGKPVVVTFWATWCPYCLKELPVLEGIQRSTHGNLQVVAVNTEKRDVFRHAARRLDQLTLKLSHDMDGEAGKAYGVKSLPRMVIIGRDGRIARVYTGYDESQLEGIVADINAVLAAP